MKRRFHISLVLLICVVAGTAAAEDTFRDRVAPILQRRCLSCHNETDRKGDFSLQTAGALLDSGYVEPGDAGSSYLVDQITPADGKAAMPKQADPLTSAEIKVIRAWIDAGAKWPDGVALREPAVADFDWWSYQPLRRPAVPAVETDWNLRTPVDTFVARMHAQQGLSPAEEADRRTLIRRVTYDLTGLPPTPEEVRAFVSDDDPKAYEKLVDRLLASQHYGERWARHWLDVAQYADTCGYDKDKLRPNAWPYRDYVIRSLNNDKPYARFVQEQIAGDVLFPGEPDGIVALGFLAAGPWDFIGHVEVPESKLDGKVARNLDRDDMVTNTLNTFCSVTVGCARCHNHKFDPITQEHYYGLQSIFAAIDRAERPYDVDEDVAQQRTELAAALEQLRQQRKAWQRGTDRAGGERLAKLNDEIARLQKNQTVEKEPQFGYHSQIEPRADLTKWVSVDLGSAVELNRIVLRPCHDEYAGIGAGFGFPVRFRIEIATESDQWTTIADETAADVANPGLTPYASKFNAAKARWIRVSATQLAERQNDFIFALAELQAFGSGDDNLALHKPVESLDSIEAPVRWARANLTDGRWATGADPDAASRLAEAVAERDKLLAKIETPERLRQRDQFDRRIADAEKQLASLPKPQMVYAAATHFPPQSNFKPTEGKLRPVHVLHRGDVQHPREAAVPGVIPLSKDSDYHFDSELNEAERRAALARWLTLEEHPLVWRSIVNRVWQYHFGQGIVATPNDFGRMGSRPTHPELLDWLAVEFRDRGGSLKELNRLIVTSSVYRQASTHRAEHAAVDGGNRYLWRMDRRRLSAEEIRDSILSVSGALDRSMGGPGFYLFELEKTAHSPHYQYHKFDPADPKSHRRSIYRFIVRSQPDPWMTTLDCADSSQSTPRRTETLTSLQALSLLNSDFNLYMAQRFAQRITAEEESLDEQVERAIWLIAQRPPTAEESRELTDYARKHGLENTCRLMFNLSEFVYLD